MCLFAKMEKQNREDIIRHTKVCVVRRMSECKEKNRTEKKKKEWIDTVYVHDTVCIFCIFAKCEHSKYEMLEIFYTELFRFFFPFWYGAVCVYSSSVLLSVSFCAPIIKVIIRWEGTPKLIWLYFIWCFQNVHHVPSMN